MLTIIFVRAANLTAAVVSAALLTAFVTIPAVPAHAGHHAAEIIASH